MNQRFIILLGTLFLIAAGGHAGAADIKQLWEKNCTQCHGPDGKGETKMGRKLNIPKLVEAKVQDNRTDEQMFKSVKEGVKDRDGKFRMKPAENVTDAEIKALVAYARTFKGK